MRLLRHRKEAHLLADWGLEEYILHGFINLSAEHCISSYHFRRGLSGNMIGKKCFAHP